MDDRRRGAVLRSQFKKVTEKPNEFLKFYMNESDMSTWYVLLSGISGSENEYIGGEYIVRICLPANYPYNPPEFYFMTPQGLYELETKVCISIGEYHSKDYRPVLGVAGFCVNLVSGLVGWKTIGSGISLVTSTCAEKKKMAADSRAYNLMHNATILRKIADSFAAYSAKWVTAQPTYLTAQSDSASTTPADAPVQNE